MLTKLIEGIYAVADAPAIYMPKHDALVVADIHLGFEEEMASKGVFLPRMQVRRALQVLAKCQELVNAKNLIVAGDLKHLFEKLGRREAKDVVEFLNNVGPMFKEIILVRGNHDTFVYVKLREYGVDVVDELLIDDVLIVHGHRPLQGNISPRVVVLGHEHPSIAIRDPLGTVAKLPCFLVVPLKRGSIAIVMPALGMYQSGTSVTTIPDSYLSPILKNDALLEEAKPYAVIEGEGIYELPKLSLLESFLQTTL